MTSTSPILRTDSVTLAWDKHTVSTDLTVEVPQGQFTAIIGPNGCGKSTLLKSFARILQPHTGQVYLGDNPLDSLHTKYIAQRIALLPQTALAPADITVEELVGRGRFPYQTLLRQWSTKDAQAVDSALLATGTAQLRHRRVTELSGGQRQRVWLAMVLAQNTPVVLLDEPTTYLDVAHQYQLLELARALRQQLGRTIVTVLHDLQQAVRYADHLIVMKGGAVYAEGAPSSIMTPQLISEVFEINVDVHTIDDHVVIVPKTMPQPDVSVLENLQ
ncbi:ABC transporter ATP-binding protein [Corynebacterium diphtheriae]|uniref:ABC transporter ATP-binding protein n=1 Tax=Corynebacterium diphtheriae TaxID=1717 RepID=UPI00086C4E36|nr:ABC transporter ATP-binding protein [Corynebacterium diphtheriae]MBG9227710.1 ABC transporter ATP-binding protein [Corynebacterium diphtheriae bv. gravis]MBG9249671.1 ABC transporter ATP-binding protein [Corynebacterium diphtheriae bv. mitis]MBG9254296.1 ABC transporter ATP-binding protein [Corynebacterium diphtheriae bv. mitis]MBG9261270.1 ABC transporter ATP-binding protein [Corynebacterium diphtheriae bv. mitis]MBG9268021.1 ABC transporter ATP-binding protein [Corynebacterium diphtheriae